MDYHVFDDCDGKRYYVGTFDNGSSSLPNTFVPNLD